MWALYRTYYDRVDEARSFADLDDKDDVVLVRDRLGGLQGFTTLARYRHVVDGRAYPIVFSGDTVIATPFQGQTALQRARTGGEPAGQVAARELEVQRITTALRRADALADDVAAAIEAA